MDSKQTPSSPRNDPSEGCSQHENPPPYTPANISLAAPLLAPNPPVQRRVVLVGALNESMRMYCPYENIEVDTEISYAPGTRLQT